MKEFSPNYHHILNAAKNISSTRMPLYEHNISDKFMEKAMNMKFADLALGSGIERKEYMKQYVGFFRAMGYDTVSYERCIGLIMSGS